MNVTEQKLIDRAKSSGRNVGAICHGYRSGRKNGRYGSREANALHSLMAKGIVRVLKVESYRDCRQTYSDHWTEAVYELV